MIQHYNFTATLTKICFYKAKLAEVTSLLLCKLLSIYSISAICICMYILMCFRSLATKNASFEMIREVTVFLQWHNTAMYCRPLLFILKNIFLVGFTIFFCQKSSISILEILNSPWWVSFQVQMPPSLMPKLFVVPFRLQNVWIHILC